MAASREELERELAVLRVRAADAAAEGREDLSTLQLLQRVQSELKALEAPAGNLPARESGVWSPLPLHSSVGFAAPSPTPPPVAAPASRPPRTVPVTNIRLTATVDDTLDDIITGAFRRWSDQSRSYRIDVLIDLAAAHPDGPVNCIANGALKALTGSANPAPRIALWDPPPSYLQSGADTPDAVTGLTPNSSRILNLLARLATPESPVLMTDLIRASAGVLPAARIEAEISAFLHPSRACPLVVQLSDRLHVTAAALDLLRGECVIPMLLVNGFEGDATRVPPHPIAETIEAVIQRLDLPGETFAPDLVPDPRALGVIARETVADYLFSGKGVRRWRARADFQFGTSREIHLSDLSWALPPPELEERIEYVRRGLGRLVGVVGMGPAGPGALRVRVEHERYTLGVWWELLSSGILERTWLVNLLVRHHDEVRRMTGLELIDAFLERRLESLTASPARTAVQLAWDRAHAQEGVCVALRALDEVLLALAQQNPVLALTAVRLKPAPTLPLRSSHDYARGFSEAQASHLVGMTDLASRRVADEDARWLTLRADVDREIAHPAPNTPRARLRRELLALKSRLGQPRETTILETFR